MVVENFIFGYARYCEVTASSTYAVEEFDMVKNYDLMDFQGSIEAAECLVVLFSCVKGSANEAHKAYGVLGGSVFLNVPDFKVEKQHEITWLKNASFLVKTAWWKRTGGNYLVTVYNDKGQPQVKKSLNLSFQEIVSKPEIKWICSQKLIKVICEITKRH
ncbi:unnamed protein product [Caretta caretta]